MTTALAVRTLIAVVVCPNLDSFHKSLFVQYLITPDKIIDEPSFGKAQRTIKEYPQCEMVVIERACRHCRKKGVQ